MAVDPLYDSVVRDGTHICRRGQSHHSTQPCPRIGWEPLIKATLREPSGSQMANSASCLLCTAARERLLMGLSVAVQPSMLRCRVRATEAVGIIVAAVGMDVLGGALQEFVAAALQVGVPSAILPA